MKVTWFLMQFTPTATEHYFNVGCVTTEEETLEAAYDKALTLIPEGVRIWSYMKETTEDTPCEAAEPGKDL